jgi:hypothetical protein
MSLLLPQILLKRLPDQAIGGVNVADMHTAILAMFASGTYFNGDARTAGAGQAWSLQASEGAPVEASCFAPPTGSPCSARVLLAGVNAAKIPQMWGAPTDTWLANALLVGVSSNGGSLSTWDSATPLGASARWTKFIRTSTALGAAAGVLRGAEGSEGFLLHWTNGTNQGFFYAGAIFDVGVASALNAETDQRLYGIISSGGDAIPTSWEAAANLFMGHNGSANKPHCIYLSPGASIVRAAQRVNIRAGVTTATSSKMPSGAFAFDGDIEYEDVTTLYRVGTLRGIYHGPQGRTGRTATDTQVFHAFGGSVSADCDCAWIRSL